MIKFTDDKEQIISLWRSVFKEDSREDVLFFLEESKNIKCFGCFEKEKLVSMLFLADCCYADLTGKYVYAVCTDEGFRNKGYSSSLIDEAKKYMKDFLWLIPANYIQIKTLKIKLFLMKKKKLLNIYMREVIILILSEWFIQLKISLQAIQVSR